jgi:membrane protein
MDKNIIIDAFRWIVGSIDYFIYSIIEFVTQGIFDLSSLRVHIGIIDSFRNRIYAILGVIMLFKLTISFFQLMFDPDKVLDSKKGVRKIFTNVFIVIIIIMLLPTAFNILYRAQKVFLPVLPRILFAEEKTSNNVDETVKKNSNQMSLILLRSFFSPRRDPNNNYASVDGTKEIESIKEFSEKIIENDNSGFLGFGSHYRYEYKWPLSTIVGAITVFLLFSITLKVAIRVFKMIILEMIAPIPVLSLLDTSDKKDQAFYSWLRTLTSTFLDIFLSLGTIYIVLYFINALATDKLFIDYGAAEGLKEDPMRLAYLKVILILGLLKFAKDIPGFVKSIIGVKDDNKELSATIGGIVGGMTGTALGAVGGLVGGRSLTGALTGAVAGARTGYTNGKKGTSTLEAYKSGGSLATQIRTGNKDAKMRSITDVIQDKASSIQKSSVQRKYNATQWHLEQAKKNMKNAEVEMTTAQTRQAQAKLNYEQIVSTHPNDTVGIGIAKAELDRTTTVSDQKAVEYENAKKNFEEIKTYIDPKETFIEKYRDNRPKQEKTTVVDKARSVVNQTTVEQERDARIARKDTKMQTLTTHNLTEKNRGFDPNKR